MTDDPTIWPISCPHCGRVNEAHDNPDLDKLPQAGDVSLCYGCARPAIFVGDAGHLRLRVPTHVELHEILAAPQIVAAIAGIERGAGVDASIEALRDAP